MRRGSPSTRHGRTSTHVDRVVLRTFVAAAGLACVAMGVVAIATGEPTGLMTRSVLSALIAGYALWRLQTGRNAVPVLFVSMAVIVVAMALRQSLEAIGSGTLGVVGLALAAALLSSSRGTVLAASAAAVASITIIRWRLLDESALDLIASGFVAMIVIVFGSQLMEWAKQEITGRDRRFDTLFDHVPVPLWEEDFSAVARWLDDLRAGGVTDLREYLEARPNEVRRGVSLIHVVDVNVETLRYLEAPERDALIGPLDPEMVVDDGLVAIIEEFVAVWEGRPNLRVRLAGSNTAGHPIEGYLLMAASETDAGVDWSQVVVAIVDMSDQWAAQRRLQEIVDSKDQFIASVSHELRTPLTAVIGFADELRSTMDVSAAERDELLALIADQAREVGDIVEDLLVAAQANIGKVKFLPESIDLGWAVEHFVAGLDGFGNRPVVVVDDDVTAIVDPRRLRQILRNLVSNAHRYGGDRVDVSARRSGAHAVIEVTDDGDGIPEALEERVFEPYETAHRSTGVTGSVGLGLTVSRQLARLMGGDLTYHRAGGATTFRLTLPAAESDATRLVS